MDNPAIFIDEVQSFTNTDPTPLNSQITALRNAINPTATPLSTQISNLDTRINTINNAVSGISPIKKIVNIVIEDKEVRYIGLDGLNIGNIRLYLVNSSGTISLSGTSNDYPSYLWISFLSDTFTINKTAIISDLYYYYYSNGSIGSGIKLFSFWSSNRLYFRQPTKLSGSSSTNFSSSNIGTGIISGSIQLIEYN